GVEPQSETVWRQADRYRVPRICFANKMDRVGADLVATVASMVERLAANPVVIQLPIGKEDKLRGIVDLIRMNALVWDDESLGAKYRVEPIPADMAEQVAEYREKLIDSATHFDDPLMETVLEGKEPKPEDIIRALRRGP